MRLQFIVLAASTVAVLSDRTSHVSFRHGGSSSFQHSSHHSFNNKPLFPKSPHPPPTRPPTYKPIRERIPKPTEPATYPSPTTETYTPTVPEVESYETTPPPHTTPHYVPTPKIEVTKKTTPYGPPHPPKKPHHQPPPHPHVDSYDEEVPECSLNTTKSWCLEDYDYPMYEIQGAAQKHGDKLLKLYADLAELDTSNSVEGLDTIEQETYLCSTETNYIRPLRAVNVDDKWRIIVNDIKVNYVKVTQTARIEECLYSGEPCPLIPKCYDSKCTQKSVYHRFLVYDPYDLYFPFVVESFKLPASCSCVLGAFYIE